ncbi:MAG: sugar phosphate isomerase/epimerase [Lachnospiraceae bacterium]|nr:sugar phosphate isomerase/epimerase [Lachnospiraceae bacterium]
MKLSVSNIGWTVQQDKEMYAWLQNQGFQGIEIAPTRLFPERPYDYKSVVADVAERLYRMYDLQIPSMQSIWYGMTQRIAGSPAERAALYKYTKLAIDFAAACGCQNIVFGCPKNRTVSTGVDVSINEQFLWDIAQAADMRHVIIGLEANPPAYQTNYINTTPQAVKVLRQLNHPALKLNLDFGTILANEEQLNILENNLDLISHVHISEPWLKPLQRREEHKTLRRLLEQKYKGFISLEMARPQNPDELKESCLYLKEVFG